jgi:hypothetical protein
VKDALGFDLAEMQFRKPGGEKYILQSGASPLVQFASLAEHDQGLNLTIGMRG